MDVQCERLRHKTGSGALRKELRGSKYPMFKASGPKKH